MKPSAYRSMNLAKRGKTNPQNVGGLRRWINEDWRNLTPYAFNITTLEGSPACGDSSKNPRGQKSVCRPLKAVSDKTPTLATAFTKQQIRKAVRLKNMGKVILWERL
jgi:hypothetical protein